MPAAWTRPSQAYRKESVLVLGGAVSPVADRAIPPARTSAPSRRSGTRLDSHSAAANSAQDTRYQPSSPAPTPMGPATILSRTAARAARTPTRASVLRLTGGSVARRGLPGAVVAVVVRAP
ncbi:hypothetical protein BKM31_30230 [[Actinomadura] parvosata subsp. kistnae]|uniref:Uncharacterized protein n=1 Tax=[Actinomadura] parvosata subsp. kistnae TaxID=1909395 RepID=A0A1V0A4M9_9ACTN|nr:hypothetical protein BKM31_30230 [Nonomuraea sp. ATCC 55076]